MKKGISVIVSGFFLITCVLFFVLGIASAQSWDTTAEDDLKFAHPNWIACKKLAPLKRAEYVTFARKIFNNKKDQKIISELCGERQDDVVKEVVCNLGKYLLDRDGRRFAENAYKASTRSKIFFYLNEIFFDEKNENLLIKFISGKTIDNLYWGELATLAKGGNGKAFEAMMNLSADADGEAAEFFSGGLTDFFIENPKQVGNYWGVLKSHKKTLASYFDLMEFTVEDKYRSGCGKDVHCNEVKALFSKLKGMLKE